MPVHTLRLALDGRLDVGPSKEFSTRMSPTPCFQDRARTAIGCVKLSIAAIGVGLQDAGICGEVPLRMFAAAVT